jgi:hypothetical protein
MLQANEPVQHTSQQMYSTPENTYMGSMYQASQSKFGRSLMQTINPESSDECNGFDQSKRTIQRVNELFEPSENVRRKGKA